MRKALWLLAAAAVFLGAVGGGAWWVKNRVVGCDSGTSKVLHSLPSAGGLDVDRNVSGDCYVEFETFAPMEKFTRNYERRLEAEGWKVSGPEVPTNSLVARRGRWRVSVEHLVDVRGKGGGFLVDVAAYEVGD
jgi:hypothetical protein